MNDNRVTQEQIDALLDSAETQEHTFWGKELVVSYRLESGFTVTGRGACVDPANFDLAIGRDLARKDVAKQLWQLEGYRLQLELALPSVDAIVGIMPPLPDDPQWLDRMRGNVEPAPVFEPAAVADDPLEPRD